MKEKKLRRKLRKKAVKLLQFAEENNIKHVSMFANIKDGKPFIYAMASNDGINLMAPIAEFVDEGGEADA